MMLGNSNSKCHLEFIIILPYMMLFFHYFLQNFGFMAVFSLCNNTWGIPSLGLSVVILWPQRENCIF